MNKRNMTFLVIAILSLLYATLGAMRIVGVESGTGGIVYRLIIIATLIFSCSRSIKASGKNVAVLAGVLGLGSFVLFEIYSFAYIYLYGGKTTDITVSNFTWNCGYLFFIVAALYLTPPVFKAHKVFRTALGVISSAAIVMIFYSIVDNDYHLLVYSELLVTIVCLLTMIVLLKNYRLLAASIIFLCLLSMTGRLLLIYDTGWNLRDFVISLYPAVYLLVGWALIDIDRSGVEAAEHE